MYPYMARKGRLGQRMMKQTAGVQANLDYSDEADAMRKLRVSMGLVPLLYAMFANSPLCDGGLNGYQSFRGHIWTDTDPDRCGSSGIRVPRRRRASRITSSTRSTCRCISSFATISYIDLTQPPGITFRQYMERGWRRRARDRSRTGAIISPPSSPRSGSRSTSRCARADSQPPALMLALPALLKGVLYDDDCIDARLGPGQALELRGAAAADRRTRTRSASRPAPAASACASSRSNC